MGNSSEEQSTILTLTAAHQYPCAATPVLLLLPGPAPDQLQSPLCSVSMTPETRPCMPRLALNWFRKYSTRYAFLDRHLQFNPNSCSCTAVSGLFSILIGSLYHFTVAKLSLCIFMYVSISFFYPRTVLISAGAIQLLQLPAYHNSYSFMHHGWRRIQTCGVFPYI